MCEMLSVCTGDQPGERKPTHTSMLLWPQLNRHRLVSHSKQYWRSHFPAGLSESGSLFYSTIVLFYYGFQRAKCTIALRGSMRESPHSSFASDVSQEKVETLGHFPHTIFLNQYSLERAMDVQTLNGDCQCPNIDRKLHVVTHLRQMTKH